MKESPCFIGQWIIHPEHEYRARTIETGTTSAYVVTRLCPGKTADTVLDYRPDKTRVCATLAEWEEEAEQTMEQLRDQRGQ